MSTGKNNKLYNRTNPLRSLPLPQTPSMRFQQRRRWTRAAWSAARWRNASCPSAPPAFSSPSFEELKIRGRGQHELAQLLQALILETHGFAWAPPACVRRARPTRRGKCRRSRSPSIGRSRPPNHRSEPSGVHKQEWILNIRVAR